jgi:hypothetical protein
LTETQRLVHAYSGIVETEIQSHLYLAAMEYYKTKVSSFCVLNYLPRAFIACSLSRTII